MEIYDSISILQNTNLDINNIDCIDLRTYNVAVKTILNLIKKQSKEIAELKIQKEKKEFIIKEQFKEMKRHIDLDNECEIAYQNKIMNLEKEIEELKEDRDKFKKALGKRITYCNELEKDLFENCSNYVVSKDKIKAKIEEYEQDVKDFEEYWSKDPRKFKKEKSVDYYKLEALKELLEKE